MTSICPAIDDVTLFTVRHIIVVLLFSTPGDWLGIRSRKCAGLSVCDFNVVNGDGKVACCC